MMKRFLALSLCFCLLFALSPAALGTDETLNTESLPMESAEPVLISDAEGLRAIAENPGGYYALSDNIDMKGVDWKPFAFSGILDGRGYSLYNLSVIFAGDESFTAVDGNLKQYTTLGVGLFSSLQGASITNLGILNARITVLSDQNCFAAILCGSMSETTLERVKVSGSVELTSSAVMVGVAGLCGFGEGVFKSCEAEVTLIHKDRLTTARAEQFTGGLLATGYASFENCKVSIAGYTSCHGYVHDGGLVGMHFRYFDPWNGITHSASGNEVSGFIRFFEDNRDRRAYCDAICGENLYGTLLAENNSDSFERQEVTDDLSTELVPHSCEESEWEQSVTAPDCEHFGYTSYRCKLCGYSYTDDYTAPAHEAGEWVITKPAGLEESGEKELRCKLCDALLDTAEIAPHVSGEWELVTEPNYQTPGKQLRRCTDCGEILEEEELPALVRTERIELSEREVKLAYKGSLSLSAKVVPENADDLSYSWSSSNTDVASVNSSGLVMARSIGDTVISCAATDGGAVSECTIHVRYTFGQQLIRIFLLGFLWY